MEYPLKLAKVSSSNKSNDSIYLSKQATNITSVPVNFIIINNGNHTHNSRKTSQNLKNKLSKQLEEFEQINHLRKLVGKRNFLNKITHDL